MRKRTFIISMCFLLFFLTACSHFSNQSSKNVSSNNSINFSNSKKISEIKGQAVSDITKLATPDVIVYAHNGLKTTYNKDDIRFQEIIKLNNKRQTKELVACKCIKDISSNGNFLIYKYTSTNYVPVYFKLVPSLDGRFENHIFNYYGSNPLPSDEKNDPTKVGVYGHLAPSDELLAYLNSKKLN